MLYNSFVIFVIFLIAEVILLAILFAVESPVASAVFGTTLLGAVFAASIPVFLHYLLVFSHIYVQVFLKITKIHILEHIFFLDSSEYLSYVNLFQ